ncbi:unnamed protein product [Soboliphyme baturini]|uniref:Secreted protein n=1 Tax=Soboliphyme baturini TaxID=241478 RepID=A0A183J191_9BILA|nr:unnamed protein product [Soboliphyme baturini]
MSDISSSMNPKFYNKYLWFWIVSEAISRTNLFFLYVAFSRHFRNAVKLILKSTFPVAWRPTMRCPFQMQSCRIPSQLHGPAMRQLTPARILKLSNRKENGRFGGDATLTKHMWISFETRNS